MRHVNKREYSSTKGISNDAKAGLIGQIIGFCGRVISAIIISNN